MNFQFIREYQKKNIQSGKWEGFQHFSSSCMIKSNINPNSDKSINVPLVMSAVTTEDIHEDDEGRTSSYIVFSGLAGKVKLPQNLGSYLKIVKNSNVSINKLEMDMAEFEKIFDVRTDDKIKTMQLLTSDVMSGLIDIFNETNIQYEFCIINDVIHMRFHTGLFNKKTMDSSLTYEELNKLYLLLINIKKITINIIDSILATPF